MQQFVVPGFLSAVVFFLPWVSINQKDNMFVHIFSSSFLAQQLDIESSLVYGLSSLVCSLLLPSSVLFPVSSCSPPILPQSIIVVCHQVICCSLYWRTSSFHMCTQSIREYLQPAKAFSLYNVTDDIHGSSYDLYDSLLYLILHLSFSCTGPLIQISIFLSDDSLSVLV
jgi:hypothetical protein